MKFIIFFLSLLSWAIAAERVVLDAVSVKNLRIESVAAEEGDFAKIIPALGQLEVIPNQRAVLSSRIPGRILESRLVLGSYVEKGADLVLLESRQAGDPPPSIWLKAPMSGIVLSVSAWLGSPVEASDSLCEIVDLRTMYAVASLPQQQAGEIAQGTVASLLLPLLPEKKLQGTLLRFTPSTDSRYTAGSNLTASSGEEQSDRNSAGLIFTVDNPDNVLRPGMKVQFQISTAVRKNVMSIPREALQGDSISRYVFIKDYELKHAFVKAVVTVGEINAKRVEILSGLFPGDEVVTRGSYGLSFAGKGSVSLKEAMDAAHGHPHNEDGTEMTKEQLAAKSTGDDHDHGGAQSSASPWLLWFLTGTCVLLFVLLVFSATWARKSSNSSSVC